MAHKGEKISEVWNSRLSTAAPTLYNAGETWLVKLHCKKTGDVLEEHDSGILTTVDGVKNYHDCIAIAACYDWLRGVRDNYSLPGIELRKPVVAIIETANELCLKLTTEAAEADAAGDTALADQKRGELVRHQKLSKKQITTATAEMTAAIEGGA